MADSQEHIKDILRTLAQSNARFITLSDLCEALQFHPEECMQVLQTYIEEGLLRTTQSNGESYFWLTQRLAD